MNAHGQLRQRYLDRMELRNADRPSPGVRPLLQAEEWDQMLVHLKAWLHAGADTPPNQSIEVLEDFVQRMIDRAVDWCRSKAVVIRLSNHGFSAVRASTNNERRALVEEAWANEVTDDAIRFTAPYAVAQGGVSEARLLKRIRSPDASRWRSEIENAVWFAIGDRMKKYIRATAASGLSVAPAPLHENMDASTGTRRREVAAMVDDRNSTQPDLFMALVEWCRHEHKRCVDLIEAVAAKTQPNAMRRAPILLADSYRAGRFDRRACHLHYRDLVVFRDPATSDRTITLGPLLDELDLLLGLPPNLPPWSPRRNATALASLPQSTLRTACRPFDIRFGADIAGALRDIRDAFRVQLQDHLRL
jgi:hypothetical protein